MSGLASTFPELFYEEEFFDLIYNGVNYGEYYRISKSGQVRNEDRGNLLTSDFYHQDENTYPQILVCINGERVCVYLHRAMACTFLPNHLPERFNIVNPRDGDKKNFQLWNLEWCDQAYNRYHGLITELGYRESEVKTGNKLNLDDYLELIREHPLEFDTMTPTEIHNMRRDYERRKYELAELPVKYGYSIDAVKKIVEYKVLSEII